MAIDTRSRRASVLGVTGALLLALPLSDGTVGQEDRQHVAFSYAGIAAGTPVAIPECLFGLSSIMDANMAGVTSTMSDAALGAQSTMDPTFGLASIMSADALGVSNTMSDGALGVESELC